MKKAVGFGVEDYSAFFSGCDDVELAAADGAKKSGTWVQRR